MNKIIAICNDSATINDIKIVNGIYTFNGKECIISNSLDCIIKMITNDKTALQVNIKIKIEYIENENLYIANL